MKTNTPAFWQAFNLRDDLKQYGVDALLLFALQLKFGIEDINIIASNCLTEGGEDKKADLVYIDYDWKRAVIAQTYFAQKVAGKNGKLKTAPSDKADSLTTAVTWLLGRPIGTLPENLKTHAEELRRAMEEGTIKHLDIWYVHNLLESKNVNDALDTVKHASAPLIKTRFPKTDCTVQALEIGVTILDEWYKAISTPILVSDDFTIPILNGFEIPGSDWRAYVTAIPASFLYTLFVKYGTDLFSADIRDYLGSRESDNNINNGIKQTAENNPGHFWAYNNGITVLVNEFKEGKGKKKLHISGFSIVNGAQTTGTIGNLKKPPEDSAMVQVRFIICSNQETLRQIVKYNNTQNKMLGPDSRSNDAIQTRLIKEFKEIKISYLSRRGGREDIIRRQSDGLPSVVAGQALAAFHGRPDVAYHEKTRMWDDNSLYTTYFNDLTTAKHVLFALSLLKAVEKKKMLLWDKNKAANLIGKENDQFDFFRKRGSILMMTSAIASCLEDILGKQVPDPFDLAFKKKLSLEAAVYNWAPIINASSAFTEPLVEGLADGFKAHKTVGMAIKKFQSLIVATRESNDKIYADFAKEVK